MRKIRPVKKDEELILVPIEDRVAASLYGDAELQEKILRILAEALDTEIVIHSEGPYETKKGFTGNYMYIKLNLTK